MRGFLFQLIFMMLSVSPVWATLEVALGETEASENKALVRMTMKNSFAQPIKSARVWLILMDGEGKIVGNKAQWLTAMNDDDKKKEADGMLHMAPDEQQDFAVVVDTTRKVQDVKLTFSRIVMADGSLADPRKDVVALEE